MDDAGEGFTVTPRQIALLRFKQQHQWMSEILSPIAASRLYTAKHDDLNADHWQKTSLCLVVSIFVCIKPI